MPQSQPPPPPPHPRRILALDPGERRTGVAISDELKAALNGNDLAAIRAAQEKLMTASQAFSQKLYEAAARDQGAEGSSASGQTGSSSGTGAAGADDDVVDAEIVDEQ